MVIHTPWPTPARQPTAGPTVEAMHILDEIAALRTRGTDILRAAFTQAPRDLVARTGISLREARTWRRTADDYLGPTRFTAHRRRVITAAERHGHSLETLVMINKHARTLPTPADAWRLREQLTAMDADHDTIAAAAKKAVAPTAGAADPTPRLRHGVDTKRGRMTFHFSTGLRHGRDLLHTLHAAAGDATGRGLTEEDKGRAFADLLSGDTAPAATTLTPLVVVGLNSLSRILDGTGDEITLALTDGTTMTGAEFLAATLSDYSYVGLYHPVAGPANLYRTQRLFNRKQRLLARAESPVCAWPDCHRAAEACEAHHLTDWGEGGQTNASEAAMLCAYHNSVNRRRGRGHMIRDGDGLLKWVPPGGGAPLVKDHPVSALGAMHLL